MVLVLYKTDKGETRCIYVRFWPAAKSSAVFHHHAMHVVVAHIRSKKLVPGLRRIRLWTDGDGTAYKGNFKGFPNFGRMAYWPLMPSSSVVICDMLSLFAQCLTISLSQFQEGSSSGVLVEGMADAEGLDVVHSFFESHHASGVQDSAGKDPRVAMMNEMGQHKASFSDAHERYMRYCSLLSYIIYIACLCFFFCTWRIWPNHSEIPGQQLKRFPVHLLKDISLLMSICGIVLLMANVIHIKIYIRQSMKPGRYV